MSYLDQLREKQASLVPTNWTVIYHPEQYDNESLDGVEPEIEVVNNTWANVCEYAFAKAKRLGLSNVTINEPK